MAYGVIYVITNLIDGKKYVGQTTRTIKERFSEHARRKNSLIGQTIRIYGRDKFSAEVLEECTTQDELNTREISWIALFNCIFPHGYNITIGGGHRHPTLRAKRGSKQKVSLEKKFHTQRKWDAYPVLEAELQKRFITDAKLAEILGLKSAEISRKMKGERNLTSVQMEAIKNFLQVDIPFGELFRRNPDVHFLGKPCVRHLDTFPALEAELQRQKIKALQLSKLLKMSIQSVSRRMQGIYNFKPAQMEAIKNFLQVDIPLEELFRRAE